MDHEALPDVSRGCRQLSDQLMIIQWLQRIRLPVRIVLLDQLTDMSEG